MTTAVDDVARRDFARTWDLDDLTVRQDGNGRTVAAYVTPFNNPTEIRDADGHYNETVGRSAFDKTIAERGLNFAVLYNHGKTYDGRTDGALMVPVGVPRLLQPHDRGLYSETEYLENPLADAVLDAVKKKAIRGYSFTGSFIKSQRTRSAGTGALASIHRSEIAMREYGPVLYPAYAGAAIIGTRSVQSFIDELFAADPEDVDRFRQLLGIATPLEPAAPDGTAPAAAVTAHDDPAAGQSERQSTEALRRKIRARNTQKGIRK